MVCHMVDTQAPLGLKCSICHPFRVVKSCFDVGRSLHDFTNFFKQNLVFILNLTVTVDDVFLCFSHIYALYVLAFPRRFCDWFYVGDSTPVAPIVVKVLLLKKKFGRSIVYRIVSSHLYL